MLQKTKGFILKDQKIGENDKILTILTADYGVIEAVARRVKFMKSPFAAASQLLTYAEFCLFKGKQSYYIIDNAEIISSFYSLRFDVEKLALGGYFCELTNTLSPSAETSADFLRLILNTLHKLQEGKIVNDQLKCIFELRGLSIGGFMPNLVGCSKCGQFVKTPMLFLPLEGILFCNECFKESSYENKNSVKYSITPPVFSAMRHIVYSDILRLFSFRLAGNSLKQLSFICENYALLHTEKHYKSLDIYHRIHSGIEVK